MKPASSILTGTKFTAVKDDSRSLFILLVCSTSLVIMTRTKDSGFDAVVSTSGGPLIDMATLPASLRAAPHIVNTVSGVILIVGFVSIGGATISLSSCLVSIGPSSIAGVLIVSSPSIAPSSILETDALHSCLGRLLLGEPGTSSVVSSSMSLPSVASGESVAAGAALATATAAAAAAAARFLLPECSVPLVAFLLSVSDILKSWQ